jgi:hypothetical protein
MVGVDDVSPSVVLSERVPIHGPANASLKVHAGRGFVEMENCALRVTAGGIETMFSAPNALTISAHSGVSIHPNY